MALAGKNLIGAVYDQFVSGSRAVVGAPRRMAFYVDDVSGRRVVGGLPGHMERLLAARSVGDVINHHVGLHDNSFNCRSTAVFTGGQFRRQDAAGESEVRAGDSQVAGVNTDALINRALKPIGKNLDPLGFRTA